MAFLQPLDPAAAGLPLTIRRDPLDDPRVIALLQFHRHDMTLHSPAASIHALDVAGLRAPGLTFWSAWRGDDLLGCGALQGLGDGQGELKSMRTVAAVQGQGVASALLRHLVDAACARGWRRLSLETGSAAAFAPAHRLYARHGFAACGPFGTYVDDPYSVFMTRALGDGQDAALAD
uniref:GNAT family N-acetyltransferase n=1 Tax=Luteimonas sp. 4-12 TaxID=2027406 RepID=UPI0031B59EBC